MSDSLSSGYASEQAGNVLKSKCTSKKSKNGKHKWKHKGSWPSQYGECVYCGRMYFMK